MSTKIPLKGALDPISGNPKSNNHSSNSPKHSPKLPSKSTKAKINAVAAFEGDALNSSPSPSSKAHHRTNNNNNTVNISHKKTNNATTSSSHPSPENSRKELSPIRSEKSSPMGRSSGSKLKQKMKSHRSDKIVNSNHYIPIEDGKRSRSCWGMLLISMGIRKETVHLRTAYAKEAAQALSLEQWHLQKVYYTFYCTVSFKSYCTSYC